MTDVNISIETAGDVTGLNKIEQGYKSLIGKVKQAYQSITDVSPIRVMADRQAQERKMSELSRKANEIDRKIMTAKLDVAEGRIPKEDGATSIQRLQTESMRINYERAIAGDRMKEINQRRQLMGRIMAPGRFVAGKALRYGGAIAGIAGAYGLFSGIAGEMGAAGEREEAFATALSQARGRTGIGFAEYQAFFDINRILKEMGETALATSKDMMPMLEVSKELGDFMGGAQGFTGRFARNVNLAKMLGIDAATLAQLYTPGIRMGGFGNIDQMQGMAQMLMLNPNMRHRGTEALQAFQQLMGGTTTGTQGLEAFGMFNLMNTLNTSRFRAYRGMAGAQRLLNVNQAFTGGGNENFQYFQTLALSPAFQEANARRVAQWRAVQGGPTNYGAGRYDQVIADVFQELGAFATPADVMKQLNQMGFGGAAEYVGRQYQDPNKMNIQRVFEQYRAAYGSKNEGQRLFMTAQMAKDLGVSFTDIGVLNTALQDKGFMKLAAQGGLTPEQMAKTYNDFISSGRDQTKLLEVQEAKARKEQAFQEMAEHIKKMVTDLLPVIAPALTKMAEHLPVLTDSIVGLINFFTKKRGQPPGPSKITKEQIPLVEESGLLTVEKGEIKQVKTRFGLPVLPGIGTFKRSPTPEENIPSTQENNVNVNVNVLPANGLVPLAD
jgi:hypothetical protein